MPRDSSGMLPGRSEEVHSSSKKLRGPLRKALRRLSEAWANCGKLEQGARGSKAGRKRLQVKNTKPPIAESNFGKAQNAKAQELWSANARDERQERTLIRSGDAMGWGGAVCVGLEYHSSASDADAIASAPDGAVLPNDATA